MQGKDSAFEKLASKVHAFFWGSKESFTVKGFDFYLGSQSLAPEYLLM